jgi:hypothetical protein
MSTKYIINNLSEQTINGQPIDLRYKVYTALLSQKGGDILEAFTWEYLSPKPKLPKLLKGVSYHIISNDSNTDFTICGAPSNSNGTNFVANGEQPKWVSPFEKEGSYIQIEWNTGAPVVTVLENTIGNIWFTYDGVGDYTVKSDGLFTDNKTTFNINLMGVDVTTGYVCLGDISDESTNRITIGSAKGNNDDILTDKTPIEIKVYN